MPVADPILEAYERLRLSFEPWVRLVSNLSPASPDYRERLEGEWLRNGVTEAFWRLEQMVIPEQVER